MSIKPLSCVRRALCQAGQLLSPSSCGGTSPPAKIVKRRAAHAADDECSLQSAGQHMRQHMRAGSKQASSLQHEVFGPHASNPALRHPQPSHFNQRSIWQRTCTLPLSPLNSSGSAAATSR